MERAFIDRVSVEVATGTTRRRALAGLGALVLGGATVLGHARSAAAEVSDEKVRSRCVSDCVNRGGRNNKRQRRKRCRRECRRKG